MATKRSALPPLTDAVAREHPERIRTTPNGGRAWKCHYCSQFASSTTQRNLFVCRRHGGVTPTQRTGQGKPPGRPMTTGEDTRSRLLNVNEIVMGYKQKLVDIDATDEDLLHLRAYLHQSIRQRPSEEEVNGALESLLAAAKIVARITPVPAPLSKDALLHVLAEIRLLRKTLNDTSSLYTRFSRINKEIEDRYARFIRLAKLRSAMAHKNEPTHQLTFFMDTVHECLNILAQRLPPDTLTLLRARLDKEFNEIPERALQANTFKDLTVTPPNDGPFYSLPHTRDALEEIVTELRSQQLDLDNTDDDLLHLRAHILSVRQLLPTVTRTARMLEALLENLDHFMNQPDTEAALRARGEWDSVQRLESTDTASTGSSKRSIKGSKRSTSASSCSPMHGKNND